MSGKKLVTIKSIKGGTATVTHEDGMPYAVGVDTAPKVMESSGHDG